MQCLGCCKNPTKYIILSKLDYGHTYHIFSKTLPKPQNTLHLMSAASVPFEPLHTANTSVIFVANAPSKKEVFLIVCCFTELARRPIQSSTSKLHDRLNKLSNFNDSVFFHW